MEITTDHTGCAYATLYVNDLETLALACRIAATWTDGSEPRLPDTESRPPAHLAELFYALATAFEAHTAIAKAA